MYTEAQNSLLGGGGEGTELKTEVDQIAAELQRLRDRYNELVNSSKIEFGDYYVGLPTTIAPPLAPMVGTSKIYVDIRQVKELIDLYYTGMKIFYLTEAKEKDGSKKMISYTTSYDNMQKDFQEIHPCYDTNSTIFKGRMVSLNSIHPFDIRINEKEVLSPLWKKSPLYGI